MKSEIVILIPHYNNIIGLINSLKSIAYPTKIDVLIVDDGSKTKPNQQELEQQFADKLSLHFLYNQQNQGIERTLNSGLRFITENLRSKYIARLDCGDICAPSRFTRQKSYLDEHPDIFLLGSWVQFLDLKDKVLFIYKAPSQHRDITKHMFLKSCFIHPVVMFRTEILDTVGFYPLNYEAAEDYAFFFNIVKNFKTHILPEVLLYYVIDPTSISLSKRNIQLKSKIQILLDNKSPSPYFVLGMIKNLVLLALPYGIVSKAKAILLK